MLRWRPSAWRVRAAAAAAARPRLAVAPASSRRRHCLAAALAGGCALSAAGAGLAAPLPLVAPPARCEGEGWSTCAKLGGCCVTTVVGGLVYLYSEVRKLMVTFALETVALGGQQIALDENQSGPAQAKLVAALRGDKLFREHFSPSQQQGGAVVLLEVARLSFRLGILASKLKDMAENLSPEAKKFLLSANEYDPSVPATAVVHATGMFADSVLQGQDAPPIWHALYPWLMHNLLAVDTTDDGVLDFAEFAACAAHAISLVVSPPIPAGTPAEEQSIQRAERMFAVVNHDAYVTGGKGGSISRATLTEWLRCMIILGVLPLDQIDRDLKSGGSNTLLRRADGHSGPGREPIEQLAQQHCVELEIGQDDVFSFDEFSLVRLNA
jgi:hypothetical protein